MKKITILLGKRNDFAYITSLVKLLEKDYEIELLITFEQKEKESFLSSNKNVLYLKKSSLKRKLKKLDSNYCITSGIYETKLVNKFLRQKNIVKIAIENQLSTEQYKRKLIFATTYFDKIVVNKKEVEKIYKEELGMKVAYMANGIKKDWLPLLKELEKRSIKRVLFISSTGGHLNEMLMLKDMFTKYPFMLVTESTPTNKDLREKYGKRVVNYLTYGTKRQKLIYPFKLLLNCFKSLYYYLCFKPDFIITTGAHSAGPMCCIAHLLKKKVIYIETFANSSAKTVTGSLVYKFADLFIVQWESMLELYENATYGGWIY